MHDDGVDTVRGMQDAQTPLVADPIGPVQAQIQMVAQYSANPNSAPPFAQHAPPGLPGFVAQPGMAPAAQLQRQQEMQQMLVQRGVGQQRPDMRMAVGQRASRGNAVQQMVEKGARAGEMGQHMAAQLVPQRQLHHHQPMPHQPRPGMPPALFCIPTVGGWEGRLVAGWRGEAREGRCEAAVQWRIVTDMRVRWSQGSRECVILWT